MGDCSENTEWATRSTWWPRSHCGTGVSPVKHPFGVQALACPDQWSLKAELRTCALHFHVLGCAPGAWETVPKIPNGQPGPLGGHEATVARASRPLSTRLEFRL